MPPEILIPGFQDLPLVTSSFDGRNFVLLKPFTFLTRAGEFIVVPIGTTSDGASTPRILWREIPPFGKYWPAAFLHDFLYRCTTRPKAECDSLLLEAMESLDVEKIERDTIYEGVHIGGQSSFDEDRAALAKEKATLQPA